MRGSLSCELVIAWLGVVSLLVSLDCWLGAGLGSWVSCARSNGKVLVKNIVFLGYLARKKDQPRNLRFSKKKSQVFIRLQLNSTTVRARILNRVV
jgi:hypothetical protein